MQNQRVSTRSTQGRTVPAIGMRGDGSMRDGSVYGLDEVDGLREAEAGKYRPTLTWWLRNLRKACNEDLAGRCETSPNTAHVWGLWQQNVSLNQLMESSRVMCWAAKWLDEKVVLFDSEYRSSHKAMLKGIHSLLSQADTSSITMVPSSTSLP